MFVVCAFEMRKIWCRYHARQECDRTNEVEAERVAAEARRRVLARAVSAYTLPIKLPFRETHTWQWTAMSSTSPAPALYVAFGAVAVAVLKTLNEVVTEPYMVSVGQEHVRRHPDRPRRMSHSTSRRRRRTARATTGLGTLRSPPHLDCECVSGIDGGHEG